MSAITANATADLCVISRQAQSASSGEHVVAKPRFRPCSLPITTCAAFSLVVEFSWIPTASTAMNQQIRFCTTPDGVQLAYAVSREGPALVMSATWLTHLEHQWQSLAWRPWLDAFTSEHKVLRHDSRGCGLSDRSTKDLSFETWVRDLECVVEAAAFRRFSMVGTCWGGPIAIEYAAGILPRNRQQARQQALIRDICPWFSSQPPDHAGTLASIQQASSASRS